MQQVRLRKRNENICLVVSPAVVVVLVRRNLSI